MFGTELDTAYMDPPVQGQFDANIPSDEPVDVSPPETDREIERIVPTYNPIVPSPPASSSNHQERRIRELETELAKRNERQDSIFDRYVSKKKDVLKLLSISLTILFALSAHHVMNDLLRNYLNFNDFSRGHETLIRLGYPAAIFFLLWSLKVFNR